MARCSKNIDRIVAAQRRAQQADRILGVGRRRHPPAGIVDELHLVGLAVPGIAALEEADRHAQHHRRGEAVVGAPAHRAAIVDLLERRLGIFAELDFGHRHQPGERHADGAADNAFLGEAGVEHALDAVLVLQAQRHAHGRRPWARYPRRTAARAG